jgi:LuxR family transcriptional regulator, glucitol operon activator
MGFSSARLTLYALLSSLEDDLRGLIRGHLGSHLSAQAILGPEVYTKAVERFEQEMKLREMAPPLERLLHYVDFPDLYKSLNGSRSELPSPLAVLLRDLTPQLDRLAGIRNRVAHSRPLHFDDLAVTTQITEQVVTLHAAYFPSLKKTAVRLGDDPGFVLGLEIPVDDAGYNHNLPTPDFDETGFVGRAQQVTDLIRHIQGAYPVITVVGDGGIGKTALALKVAYDILDLPQCPFDAVVWTSSKTAQLTPQEIIRIEGAVTDSLGVFNRVAHHLAGEAAEDPLEEVLGYMREFRILLILDNLETVLDDRIKGFLARLPQGSKVLITSRIGLGAFEFPVKLEPMDHSESVQLLRALANIRGVSYLAKLPPKQLQSYCAQMGNNPGFIKWFVSAVQAGRRPEEVLDKPDVFLDFCMSNVYNYLSDDSRRVLRALLDVPGRHSQAELVFLTDLKILDLQKAIQQLLTTNMVAIWSVPRGSSFESQYDIPDMAKQYLAKHHPSPPQEFAILNKRRQQLVAASEEIIAEHKNNPYSPFSLTIRTSSDRIVAKYLADALRLVKRKDFSNAEVLVKDARRLAPEYFEVHRVDAWLKANQLNISGARTAYEAAIELEPKSAPLRLLYGGFLLRFMDDVSAALEQFREAEKLDPTAFEIQLEIARAALYAKNYGDVRKSLDSLLKRQDLPVWHLRKAHDLNLQYYLRAADQKQNVHDYGGVLNSLEGLREAFLACPTDLRDDLMTEKLRKALQFADQCAYWLPDPDSKRRATDIAEWITANCDCVPETPSTQSAKRGIIARVGPKFGFIELSDGREAFFHRQDLARLSDWKRLSSGDEVVCEIVDNPRGNRARNVKLLASSGDGPTGKANSVAPPVLLVAPKPTERRPPKT